MSVNKMDIFEKLIEGYVKVPPSFQEQAITTLAVQLCQNDELKDIIYETGPLQYKYISWFVWENIIEERSTNMCQKLPLPSALKNNLISRLRVIALQLYNWNRKQDKFNISPLYLIGYLHSSDWTAVKMRLDETKIAKRLVLDERIPVCQRYRMACFHSIEDIIPSLWNQVSPVRRTDLIYHEELQVVKLWNFHLGGLSQELVLRDDLPLCYDLLRAAVRDGSMSIVCHYWDKLNINVRLEILRYTVMRNLLGFNFRERSREFDADIFFFLLMQISKEQRVKLFQEIFQNSEINVLTLFLRWPYLDLLIPTIKDLWKILPEETYGELLSTLANHYCGGNFYFVGRKDYLDYEYGFLIIQLLEETPDHFKRYVFGNNYQEDTNFLLHDELLYIILNKGHHKIHYRHFFKYVWKQVTLEEKRLFLKTHNGEIFCCNLATQNNGELLNSILRECFPDCEISTWRKALRLGMIK